MANSICILCSGFGLGFYIPGLFIARHLQRSAITCEVVVFEELLSEANVAKVEASRAAYQSDFAVALASQRIPSDIRTSLDQARLTALLDRWEADDIRCFVALSGHWIYVIDEYRRRRPCVTVFVEQLYLDATPAPSWRQLAKFRPDLGQAFGVARLYEPTSRSINYRISADTHQPVPWDQREKRLVTHGGGWGLGTYEQYVARLSHCDYALDVIGKTGPIPGSRPEVIRYFVDDPSWRTWHLNPDGHHYFPPFAEVTNEQGEPFFQEQCDCSGVYSLTKRSFAVISKPGAGTLVDSLSSATPVVLLEPFGPHEEANARLWSDLRLGIPFDEWAQQGFSAEVLHQAHLALLEQRAAVPEYSELLLRRVFAL